MVESIKDGSKTQKTGPKDIRARSLQYALRAINLYQHLQKQKDGASWIVGKQYLRAATSIGASIEEAQAAESRGDFIHKMGIARKETRESLYWLTLMGKSGLVSSGRIAPLMKETKELLNVITAIILKTRGTN
ncbi:MAG TPA: four helix bundle protein [Terriglobia bacterium]|nr:four helix bundle protein [Terriglobia bacterium]